jgi:hypothetical protein
MLEIVGRSFTVTDGEITSLLVQPVPGNVTDNVYAPLAKVLAGVNTAELPEVVVL